jgi:parallel beta-helix repeat protein
MKEAFAMKRGELSKVLALLWAFICIVYAAPALAQPWTITVTTNADVVNNPWVDCPPPGNNGCSLREAILVANFNGASGDVIVFASSLNGATITLDPALGGLWIGNDSGTTIDATGLATGITIDASGIAFPLSLNSANITIQGPITITNAGAGGAAIALNPGADVAWLQGVTVTNNAGTGIYLNGVNTVTISNSSISGNDAEGVVVRDSSFVNINNSTISNNGQNGLSSGVFIVGTSSIISVGPYNLIENNGGNGITVIEDFNTDNAPTTIRVFANTVRGNGSLAGDGVGIQIAGAVSFVDIGGNEIYENAAQGILVERTPAGSNGPQNLKILPVPWNGALPNYIYSNGQEGILIRDLGTQNNVVWYNWIGVDPSGNPAPNGNSGIALVGGRQITRSHPTRFAITDIRTC